MTPYQVHQKTDISHGLLRNPSPSPVLGQRALRLTSLRFQRLRQLDIFLSFVAVVKSVELQNTAGSWIHLLQL